VSPSTSKPTNDNLDMHTFVVKKFLQRNCKRSFESTSMQKWKCPIHNGILYLTNILKDDAVSLGLKVFNSDICINIYIYFKMRKSLL